MRNFCSTLQLLSTIIVTVILATLCRSQLHYFQQPSALYRTQSDYQVEPVAVASSPSLVAAHPPEYSVSHPAVIANAEIESQLPSELLKSERFYKNPRIAAALAKESWFTDKEMPVLDREAEKIPREMIFKLFHNAGWIKRR